MPIQASIPNVPSATAPIILLLSLNKESYWDEQYSTLVDSLSSKATIKRVTKASSAVTYLTNNTPSATIITDSALTERESKFDAIRETMVTYVRGGGTVVLATHFSTFVRPADMDHWFSTSWGLPWANGDYHRTTVHLNSGSCGGRFSRVGLPAQYSQKAVMLKNVVRDAAMYLPSDGSRVESAVFPPDTVDGQQTPVAFARIGEGWLGYVGDVNDETESQAVIMAMCSL